MIKFISKSYLSTFGLGFAPIAPGTFGSVFAIAYIYAFNGNSLLFHVLSFLAFTLVSFILLQITHIKKLFKLDDPSWVVQDEVSGQYLSVLVFSLCTGIIQFTNKQLLVSFLLFRLFDILKPWPASYFDKRHGHFDIMHDDLIAGIYAGLSTFLAYKIILF